METISFTQEILKLAQINSEIGLFKINPEEYKK